MKKICITVLMLMLVLSASAKQDLWPDGTPIDKWFTQEKVDVRKLGKQYVITDYGVKADSTLLQTQKIQAVIDRCAAEGGGVVVVPRGTFLSGSLFFRQGTHLHLSEAGTIKGIDNIQYYPLKETRIEGQTIKYFCALINADHIKGFSITGKGTLNGNGERFWREFWIRRQFNRQCTNLEALRPRLMYISDCEDVLLDGVRLINSAFWTCHVYRSSHVKIQNLYIYAPHEPQEAKAPSSDAIDLDFCKDVLVDGCFMSVNDDAIALKGGKGTWADKDANNGPNKNILVQNCRYGFVHSCITLGSESVMDHNVMLRNIEVDGASRVLWLKMRPDTPQRYEYVTVENIRGSATNVLVVRPWTQFFKPGDREDMPLSVCDHITIRNIDMDCKTLFNVGASDKYRLQNFTVENVRVRVTDNVTLEDDIIENMTTKNLMVEEVN